MTLYYTKLANMPHWPRRYYTTGAISPYSQKSSDDRERDNYFFQKWSWFATNLILIRIYLDIPHQWGNKTRNRQKRKHKWSTFFLLLLLIWGVSHTMCNKMYLIYRLYKVAHNKNILTHIFIYSSIIKILLSKFKIN